MTAVLSTIVQGILVVLMAPLATGLVRRVRARLQGRHGAPILLPYWTLLTLMRKETVRSTSTCWVFRLVPYVVLACALLPAFVLPLTCKGGAAAPLSHFVILAGVWMVGAVFLVLGGLDSASAFGGMGASREMTVAAFLEPAVLVTFAAFAVTARTTTVDGMMEVAGTGLLTHPWLLPAVAALALVALGENARYPVDNPATHLELTMVHEAMVLEYSGPPLALLELASTIKLTVFALLVVNLVLPVGLIAPGSHPMVWVVAPLAGLLKLVLAMSALGLAESMMAKLRFYGLAEYFYGALALGLTSLALGLLAGRS